MVSSCDCLVCKVASEQSIALQHFVSKINYRDHLRVVHRLCSADSSNEWLNHVIIHYVTIATCSQCVILKEDMCS